MSNRKHSQVGLRLFVDAAACGLALLSLTACIIIPVDYHARGVRHNVSQDSGSKLQKGVTTKADVFLLLGEPDFVSEDGQRIGYAWTKVKALLIWASYGGGGGEELQRSYILEIKFTNYRVDEAAIIKQWGPQVSPARELSVR